MGELWGLSVLNLVGITINMRMSRSPKAAVTAGEVFGLIRDGSVTTRAEIGRITGLSRTAVAARVSALQAVGLVLERTEAPSTPGRPPAGRNSGK